MPSHYLNQCWNIVNLNLRNKSQWSLKWNWYIFIHENTFENVVWKMVAILSRPQCVKVILILATLVVICKYKIQIPTFSNNLLLDVIIDSTSSWLKIMVVQNNLFLLQKDSISKLLWRSDTTWQHWTWSTLSQVMACCLMAPSYYLNQSWPIMNEGLISLYQCSMYSASLLEWIVIHCIQSFNTYWVAAVWAKNWLIVA